MAANIIDRVRGLPDTVLVNMNEVKIAFWPPSGPTRVLATEGLNGCTGVGIISRHAGILAHIAPLPPVETWSGLTDPGKQNLILKLQAVINLYNTYRHYFPQAESFVVIAYHLGSVANAEADRVVRAVLGRLGLSITTRLYNVLEAGTDRASGRTAIVIVAAVQGVMPVVEDETGSLSEFARNALRTYPIEPHFKTVFKQTARNLVIT
ncbi:hypothetical protein LTR74_018105 [Friedmanniomyces endolithicus]|nr:hypothetical protein LTR74_018105 [Friedmanniomyces endolithicus]